VVDVMGAATWRAVPVEPTEAMLVNGREALMPLVRLDSYGPLIGIWKDMLAASPVFPVGVRERVLDELDKAWLHGQRRTSWRRDEAADAILAALRPTDTGANHD
jgi:hypothetical protein